MHSHTLLIDATKAFAGHLKIDSKPGMTVLLTTIQAYND